MFVDLEECFSNRILCDNGNILYLLCLIEVPVINLFFMDHAFGVVSKNNKPIIRPRIPRFSPMLFSESFIVLCFTFRSVTHFALIFVEYNEVFVQIHFFACTCLVVLAPFCWKDYPFSIELPLHLCQRSVDCLCGSSCGLSFCFIDLCSFTNTILCWWQ